jgi:peroxiredoxin
MIPLSDSSASGSGFDEYWHLVGLFRDALHAYEANEQVPEYRRLWDATRQPATILRLMQLVDDERAADPHVVDALVWVSKMAPTWGSKEPLLSTEGDRARRILVRHHIEARSIGLAMSGIMYNDSGSEAAETFFRAALEKSPHREVCGRACYWLARYLKQQADDVCEMWLPSDDHFLEQWVEKRWGKNAVETLRARDPARLRTEAEALFERAIEEFADISEFGMKKDYDPLGRQAAKELHELRDLGVGRSAPEIAGHDTAGEPLSLHDSRGKLNLLTFFANWCRFCEAMYPQDRSLVERLDANHFAILGVNVDPDVKTVRKLTSEGMVTWRCWWDGDGRAICKEWNVSAFPTIYVIDASGVIRYRNVRGSALSTAIDNLVTEAWSIQYNIYI